MNNRPLEKTFILWRCELGQNTATTSGLSADCDVIRIAAKGRDVFLYPTRGKLLVQMAEVGRGFRCFLGDLGMAQKAKHIQPVVYRNHNYSPAGNAFAVKLHLRWIAYLQSAAEKPNINWQFVIGARGRRPDVELEAVLIHGYVGVNVPLKIINVILVDARGGLHGYGPKLKGFQNTFPIRRRLGSPPPVFPYRRCSKGDSLKAGNARVSSGQTPH